MANQATIMLRLAANIDSLEKQLDKAKAKVAQTANGMVAPMTAANKKVTNSLASSATAMSKFGQLTGNQRFIIRDVSYQIADMATQLSMGTQVLRVMGQQVPQMLGPMGVLGAVIGTVVAVAAPLVQVLLGASDQSKSLAKNLTELDQLVSSYTTLVHEAALPTDQLAKKYGTATSAARDFISALRDIDQIKLHDKMGVIVSQMQARYPDIKGFTSNQIQNVDKVLRSSVARLTAIMKMTPDQVKAAGPRTILDEQVKLEMTIKKMSELSTAVSNLSANLKLTRPQAQAILGAMADLGNAKGVKAQAAAAKELTDAIHKAYPDLAKMPKPMQDLYNKVADAGQQMAKMIGATDGAKGSISAAADAAKRLASEIRSAVSAANGFADNSALQLQLTKYDVKFAKDPVRRAVAKAAATFDAQTKAKYGNALPDGAAHQIAQERSVYLDNVRKRAELQQQLKANAASASGKMSGVDHLFANADNQLAAQKLQLELIGKTGVEAAKLRAEYAMLAEARRRNLNLDKLDATSGRTLRQEISARATAIGELTAKVQDAAAQQQFMAQEQDALKQGFLDSIVAGKSFSSVLGQVAQALEKAALQAMIFGDGPLSGLFGGGGSKGGGGILGGITHALGFRASGGPVSAGQPYIVGENEPELFVPNSNGTILPSVPKMQGAAGGAAVKLDLRVFLDDNGQLNAHVVNVAGMVSAQQIQILKDKVLPNMIVSTVKNGPVQY